MPIIRKNYLDLTEEQRREGARVARNRIRSALANPLLTPEQSLMLQEQLTKIDQWEAGTLPSSTPPPLSSVPPPGDDD